VGTFYGIGLKSVIRRFRRLRRFWDFWGVGAGLLVGGLPVNA